MSLVTTPLATHKVVLKDTLGVIKATIYTDPTGHAETAIAPGEYTAEISNLAGYIFDSGTLVENGTPVATNSLIVTTVTITSGNDTVLNTALKNV